jgi:uncharacterized membrane protein
MRKTFYGWRVVNAAFVLAVLGLGFGFYGPPVFLHAVRDARGWSLPLVSTAVTVHFLIGSIVTANLPALYQRFGVPTVTKAGALLLAVGVFGWATAAVPWQLFAATLLSGAGWVTMGVAAVNAIPLALVRARSPCRTRRGVQRRKSRRHHLLTALGRRHWRAGISDRGGRDRPRHGACDVDSR